MSDNHAVTPPGERPAVPAPPGLLAEYKTGGPGLVTTPIYAFSTDGHPLVLEGDRLIRADALGQQKMVFDGIYTPFGPPLTGPFTPAPPGLVAVFDDGREQPVVFYDVHGRAVLINEEDVTCDLVLAEALDRTVRVDYRPAANRPVPESR